MHEVLAVYDYEMRRVKSAFLRAKVLLFIPFTLIPERTTVQAEYIRKSGAWE